MQCPRPWWSAFAALSCLGACAPEPAAVKSDLPVLIASSVRSDASLHALAQGRLHLDPQGCLRIGEDGPIVIWPFGSRISRAADGRMQVVDGASGNAVRVGEEFAVAGAGVDLPPPQLTHPVPPACAHGRFWLAGPVMSETDRLAMRTREAL
jgi:hypothetical protein